MIGCSHVWLHFEHYWVVESGWAEMYDLEQERICTVVSDIEHLESYGV